MWYVIDVNKVLWVVFAPYDELFSMSAFTVHQASSENDAITKRDNLKALYAKGDKR